MNSERLSKALSEIVRRLSEEFSPETIYLFGSHAWGNPDAGSDLDILVVVTESDESPVARAQRAHGLMWGIGVPLDIIVQTRREFERFLGVKASLSYKIAHEGNRLYG